jgi:hypothetical protein
MQVSFQATTGLGAAPRVESERQGQGFDAFVELALADDGITGSSPKGPEVHVPGKDQPLLQNPGQGVGAEFQMNDGDLSGKTSGVADGMSAGSGQTNAPPKVAGVPDGLTNGGNKVADSNADNALPKIRNSDVDNHLPKMAGPAAPPAKTGRGIGVDGKRPDVPENIGTGRPSIPILDAQLASATSLSVLLALQEHDG